MSAVLIIGARGQLGMRCVHYWLEKGAQVVALTRRTDVAETVPHLTWVTGNLEQPESLEAIAEPFPKTVIFTGPIWLVPPLMPLFASKGVTRLIAFSSTSIHTKKESGKSSERELVAKLQTSEEKIVELSQAHGIATTILRPTLVYGVGMDKNVTSIANVMRKLPFFPVPLAVQGGRQPVHVDDLAMATLRLSEETKTYGNIYDVGGGEILTYRAMLQRIASTLKKRVVLLPVPAFAYVLDFAGRLLGKPERLNGAIIRRMGQDMTFDISAARQDFNWNPRAFLDASRQPKDIAFF